MLGEGEIADVEKRRYKDIWDPAFLSVSILSNDCCGRIKYVRAKEVHFQNSCRMALIYIKKFQIFPCIVVTSTTRVLPFH